MSNVKGVKNNERKAFGRQKGNHIFLAAEELRDRRIENRHAIEILLDYLGLACIMDTGVEGTVIGVNNTIVLFDN